MARPGDLASVWMGPLSKARPSERREAGPEGLRLPGDIPAFRRHDFSAPWFVHGRPALTGLVISRLHPLHAQSEDVGRRVEVPEWASETAVDATDLMYARGGPLPREVL